MIGLVVTGHGNYGTGLLSNIQLLAGEQENLIAVDFKGDSVDVLHDEFKAAFEKLKGCDGVLVLADLAGGTPFNQAVVCKTECPDQKIEVVGGASAAMLLVANSSREWADDPAELAEDVMSEAKDAIVRFVLETHEDDADEDGI